MIARGKEAAALGLHRFGFGAGPAIRLRPSPPIRAARCLPISIVPAPQRLRPTCPRAPKRRARSPNFAPSSRRSKSSRCASRKPAETGGDAQAMNRRWRDFAKCRDRGRVAHAGQATALPQQIIQSEAKARFDAASGADIGFVERLVWFWSNHFCISADKIVGDGRRLRARSDPPARARPLRRYAASGRKPSGHAVLSRQCPVDGRGIRSPASTATRA